MYVNQLRSWAYYEGPIQSAIHELKYDRNTGLAVNLATYLHQYLEDLEWDVDLIVPVPLGRKRKRERGYNQAILLAKPIAWSLGLPLRPGALQRIRETQAQVGLTKRQRVTNVRDAFSADEEIVRGKHVLVVDDVVTTGATLNACAKALKEAEAVKVFGLTLARSIQEPW